MYEPEKITILEGPTPEFQENIQLWNWGIYETLEPSAVASCELRTANGDDIRSRCKQAWKEGRSVQLDYPDELRMRKQIDVLALQLREVDEGTILKLWLHQPIDEDMLAKAEDDDEDNDLPF